MLRWLPLRIRRWLMRQLYTEHTYSAEFYPPEYENGFKFKVPVKTSEMKMFKWANLTGKSFIFVGALGHVIHDDSFRVTFDFRPTPIETPPNESVLSS